MGEYLKKAKWKLIQLAFGLIVVLFALMFINGKSVYDKKVAEWNKTKQILSE